jgi:hypothetical protein
MHQREIPHNLMLHALPARRRAQKFNRIIDPLLRELLLLPQQLAGLTGVAECVAQLVADGVARRVRVLHGREPGLVESPVGVCYCGGGGGHGGGGWLTVLCCAVGEEAGR